MNVGKGSNLRLTVVGDSGLKFGHTDSANTGREDVMRDGAN